MDTNIGDQCDEFTASMTKVGRSQALITIEDTQAESDASHKMMEEGRGHSVGEWYEKEGGKFRTSSQSQCQRLWRKLTSLKDELNQVALSNKELFSALYLLKEENTVLRATLEESYESKE